MIFKAIETSLIGATNKIGIFNRSFADLKNAIMITNSNGVIKNGIGGLFNNLSSVITTRDLSNIAEYNRLVGVEGVSSQTAWNRTMLSSSAAAQNLFNDEKNLVRSGNGVVLSQNAITRATDTMTLSAKAANVAMKALAIAGNMLTFMAIAKGIQLASEALDHLINREKYAQEALENAINTAKEYKDAISDIQSETKNTKKSVNEIASAYAKLSQGIDTFTNENTGLTNEDYEEFLNLNNQLAELFPSLTKKYDENGNAILGLGGSVESVTSKISALVEQQERLAKIEIHKSLESYVNGDEENGGQLKALEGLEKNVLNAEKELNGLDEKYNAVIAGSKVNEDILDNQIDEAKDYYKNAFGLTDEEIQDAIYRDLNVFGEGIYRFDFSNLEIDESRKDKIMEAYNSFYKGLNDNLLYAKTEFDTANQEMSSMMMMWVEDEAIYKKGGETLQILIQNMISGINWNQLEISNYDEAKNWLKTNIFSLISSVDENDKTKLSNSLNKILSLDLSELSIMETRIEVEKYLNEISQILGQENANILKIGLGFDDADINPLINNVKNKLKEGTEFDDETAQKIVENLTLDDLEIASNISTTEIDEAIKQEKNKIKSELQSFSKEGNVDLTIRPVIDSSAMQAAGWDVEDGSIATTFTQGEFIWQGDEENGQYVYVHYTPILPDGTVLTPDELADYLYGTLEGSQSILDADNKGLVLKVDTDLNIPEDDIKKFTNGEGSTAEIDGLIQKTGEWDDGIHDVQEQYYETGEGVNYVSTALDNLIAKHKEVQASSTSFIDALNSADNAEIKDELLELAKSGEITPEVFSSTEEYANLLKSTDTSAESAMNQILDLLTAQEKLAGFSQGLDKLKSAYEEFKDKDIGFVTAETLQSLPDSFKKLPEFDLFSQIVGDPTSGAEAIQQAFNDIVKAYMLSQDVLQGLVGASEHEIQSYIANFKQLGVTNAEEVVNLAVEALNSENELLNSAEAEYIDYLNNKDDYDTDYLESVASKNGQLASALGEAYKADYDNWCDLLEKKSELYNDFIERIGGSYNPEYSVVGNMAANGQNMSPDNIAKMSAMQSQIYQAQYEADKLKDQLKVNLAPINTNFGTKYSPSTSSGSKDGSEDTVNTETYDHIERKLEVIAKKTEKVGEAFEKAFSLNATNIRYKEYLSQIDEEISANNTAIQTYQAKLNSIGLSADWIAKIQNGEYSITDVTDDALNERIGLYQEYYDKLVSCQETVDELQKKRLEVQNQYAEKIIGIYEREIEKLDRIIEKREALVKLKESFSGYASKSDLKYEQKYHQKELNSLEEQNDKLIKLRKTVKKNSDAWNTYTEKINENKSSILDLTQSIAELAEKLANLPLEKLERKLDKNDTKRSLNDAKLSNATSVGAKNSILNSQISLENSDNKATQTYAKETEKAITTNVKSIKSARTSDKKGLSKSEKKKVDSYYKQIQKYTKSKKKIPSSLITKLANAGYSNLVQACSNYNESLDANKTAQETAKLTAEQTKANINELKKQQFDNIQEDYSRKSSQIQAKASKVDSQINLLQAKGYMSSAGWYNEVIKYEKQNLANSQAELKALQAKQNEMTKYTDEWWEAQDAIDSVTQSINDSTLALQEYVNKQREIHFENFEFLQGQISRLNSEAEYFIDLMQNMELSGDNGITNYGLTAMGMYYQQMQTNLSEVQRYTDMINEIESDLLKTPFDTDLLTQQQEYIDALRELITNNESLKKSIADLVKDGYDALLDSLGKVIDKYKEVLNSAKDAHDYQKNISDKTENINTLQKQIVAFSSMTGNDEVASKLQSLQVEYKDAQEDLQETMYDKYISDTEEILDEILNELETFIEELNTNELYEEGVKQIVNSTGSIHDTLKTLAETSNTPLSEQMESIWSSESIAGAIKDSALSSEITTSIESAVSSIVSAINKAEIASDKQSDASAYGEISAKYNHTDYASQLAKAKQIESDAWNNMSYVQNNVNELQKSFDALQAEKDYLLNRKMELERLYNKTKSSKEKAKYRTELDDIQGRLYSISNIENLSSQEQKRLSERLSNVTEVWSKAKSDITSIQNAQKSAVANNKNVIKELLTSISNPYSLTGEKQTELDKKVSDIVGTEAYLSDYNVEQLANLFGVENNQSAILMALKQAGFATGGIAKIVGEDGFALVRNGEGFVMPEHVPMIQGLLDMTPKINSYINTTLPNLTTSRGDVTQTIEFGDIYMSGVNDPQEFSKQLISTFQNESKVQKMFGTFVNNSLTGKNSLGIRKY